MFFRVMFVSMSLLAGEAEAPVQNAPKPALVEPDGSRPAGSIPRFQGNPPPPAELRAVSHKQAMVDTEHYLYEAYAAMDTSDAKAAWMVRYVLLPEGSEAFREIEQVYLFSSDLSKKPRVLKPEELQVEPESIVWKGKAFKLVDRRDLTTRP